VPLLLQVISESRFVLYYNYCYLLPSVLYKSVKSQDGIWHVKNITQALSTGFPTDF